MYFLNFKVAQIIKQVMSRHTDKHDNKAIQSKTYFHLILK